MNRLAAIEKIRKILFASKTFAAIGTVALVASGWSAGAEIAFTPGVDQTIVSGDILDLSGIRFDSDEFKDSTIRLAGGELRLPLECIAPIYDEASKTYTMFSLFASETTYDDYEQFLKYYSGQLGFDVAHLNEIQVYSVDLSGGGTFDVGFSDTTLSAVAVGCAPSTIEGDFTKTGNGSLILADGVSVTTRAQDGSILDVPIIDYVGKTSFGGGLSVRDGYLNILGDADFHGAVDVCGGALLVSDGSQTFEKDVAITGGYLQAVATADHSVVFKENVDVANAELWAFGKVSFEKNATISGGRGVFGTAADLYATSPVSFADSSSLTLESADVFAQASCLRVDVALDSKSTINYGNVDASNQRDIAQGNSLFVTYDENETPTYLEWNAGSENLRTARSNGNVLDKNVVGDGAIYVSTYGYQDKTGDESANGYALVVEGDKTGFSGKTYLDRAFLVLSGDAKYGTDQADNVFAVAGEYYIAQDESGRTDGKRTYDVRSCGMLGFSRDESGDAPVLNASQVQFQSGLEVRNGEISISQRYIELAQRYVDMYEEYYEEYMAIGAEEQAMMCREESERFAAEKRRYQDRLDYYANSDYVAGGARIWLDASAADQSNPELGTINASQILFDASTGVWYDKISTKSPDVDMVFNLNASDGIGIKNSAEEEEQYRLANAEDIEEIFGAPELVNAKFTQDVATGAGAVTINALDVADYAASKGMSEKEREYAAKLDTIRVGENADTAFYDALYNETDAAKVTQTIHNLSILGYNMLNSQGHFGNPTSSFFGGSTQSGMQRRGQSNHERLENPEGIGDARQASALNYDWNGLDESGDFTRQVWASFVYSAIDGDEYRDGGMKTDGYRLRRQGVIGGIRKEVDGSTSAGLFFGITKPISRASGTFEGDNLGNYGSKIKMDDFQFAIHVEKQLCDTVELAAFVGGGTQAMDWERYVNLANGGAYKYASAGTGNTLTGTLYLAQRVDLSERWTLRPTIGVDSEHSWIYAFDEKRDHAAVGVDPYMTVFTDAYGYDKTYYNRNTARVGATLSAESEQGYAGVSGRVFYGRQLGGKDAPLISLHSDNWRFEDMEAHVMGGDSLSVGAGGFMHLNPIKTFTASGEVNSIWYKNAKTLNITGGLLYRY